MSIHEKDEALLNLAMERNFITRKQYQFLVQELELSGSKGAAGRIMAAKGFITPEQRISLEDEVASGVVAPPPEGLSSPQLTQTGPGLPPPVAPGTPISSPAAVASPPPPPSPPSSAPVASRPLPHPAPVPSSSPLQPPRSPSAPAPAEQKEEFPPLPPAAYEWVLDSSLPLGQALIAARDAGAGDYHWSKDNGSTLRFCGVVHPAEGPGLSIRDVQEGVLAHLSPAEQIRLQEAGALQIEAMLPDEWRVRFSIVQTGDSASFSARFFPPVPPSTADLGLPPAVQMGLSFQDGLFMVAGPQRSGRTTTLHAILRERTATRPEPVLRIVRSIDYASRGEGTLVTTWKAGRHVPTLLEGLRRALALTPRVIVIDDLVTSEECVAALELAEAGVFVLAAVLAEHVSTAYSRFVEIAAPEEPAGMAQRFSECMRGILSQRLLPRIDVTGLILIPELLLAIPSALPVLRSGRSNQLDTAIRAGRRQGLISLDDALLDYANRNLIDRQLAAQFAHNKQVFGIAGRSGTATSPGTPLSSATATPPPSAPWPNPPQ